MSAVCRTLRTLRSTLGVMLVCAALQGCSTVDQVRQTVVGALPSFGSSSTPVVRGLEAAISARDTGRVLAILQASPGADLTGSPGSRLLRLSFSSGQPEVGAMLLCAGAPVAAVPASELNRALAFSSRRGCPVVGDLIRAGANVVAGTQNGLTALHEAVMANQVDAALTLLEAKADPNAVDDLGVTPLWAAVALGHHHLVSALLEHGADPLRSSPTSQAPVDLAERLADDLSLELLLSAIGDTAPSDRLVRARRHLQSLGRAGESASTVWDADVQRAISAFQAEFGLPRHGFATELTLAALQRAAESRLNAAMFAAVGKNDPTLLSEALRRGAKTDARDDRGWTPLMRAVQQQSYELTSVLVQHGAAVTEGADSVTPLLIAVSTRWKNQGDHSRTIRLLLERGAKRDASPPGTPTPEQLAAADPWLAQEFGVQTLDVSGWGWIVVMEHRGSPAQQSFQRGSRFPADYVKEYWSKGYYLKNVAFGRDQWLVVMERHPSGRTPAQMWFSESRWPFGRINTERARGYEVTSVVRGQGQYLIVMTAGSPKIDRAELSKRQSLSTAINAIWNERRNNEQLKLTGFWFLDDEWTVLGSSQLGFTTQKVIWDDTLRMNRLRQAWSEGYDVTDLAFGDGLWVTTLSKGSEVRGQKIVAGASFPEAAIREQWSAGFRIAHLAFGKLEQPRTGQ